MATAYKIAKDELRGLFPEYRPACKDKLREFADLLCTDYPQHTADFVCMIYDDYYDNTDNPEFIDFYNYFIEHRIRLTIETGW